MLAEALKKHGSEACVEEYRKWNELVPDADTEDDKLEWSKVQLNAPS